MDDITVGEFHRNRKIFFDTKAIEYLDNRAPNIGDVCYPPDGMKTHGTRRLIKKTGEDEYMFFSGYVADINENDERITYEGEVCDNAYTECYSRTKAIDSVGFGISIRGHYQHSPEIIS